jgi:hypothetical protein
MGLNLLALLNHLTSADVDLTTIERSDDIVFFSALGGRLFVMSTRAEAAVVYYAMAALAAAFTIAKLKNHRPASFAVATLGVLASFLGAILGANVVALIADYAVGKPLSW